VAVSKYAFSVMPDLSADRQDWSGIQEVMKRPDSGLRTCLPAGRLPEWQADEQSLYTDTIIMIRFMRRTVVVITGY